MATPAVLRRPLADPLPSVAEIADGMRRHELITRASAISFRVLMAIIPFALFVLATAGLLKLDSLWTDDLAPDIAPHVSAPVFAVLDDVATNVLGGQRVFWVTAGFALAVWEVSSAVRVVMGCLDDVYGRERRRSFGERLPTSLWLGPACGALVLAAAVVLRAGSHVAEGPLGALVRYLLAAALLWACVSALVRFAPAEKRPFQWVSFGSTLVVGGWLVSWTLYGLYLTHLAEIGSAFGAFAAVIVLLTFLEISCVVLLAGALIDALVRANASK
jgi:membrane protein